MVGLNRYNLSEHLLRFIRYLREQGFPIGSGDLLVAMQAVKAVPVVDRAVFKAALQCAVVKSPDFVPLFDAAFEHYWQGVLRREEAQSSAKSRRSLLDIRRWGEGTRQPIEENSRAVYSPMTVIGQEALDQLSPAAVAQLMPLVYQLGRTLAMRLRRRYRQRAKRGKLRFRSIVRKNLQYGGIPIRLDFQWRQPQMLRLVFLCDLSRSMQPFARFWLHFLYAAVQTLPQVEVLVFSTTLHRLTPWLRRISVESFHHFITELFPQHSGGTRIGSSLQQFYQQYRSFLDRKTVIVIVSDGLDFGEIPLLQQTARQLAVNARQLWWLYPLPIRRGQQIRTTALTAVRPFLSGEATVYNFESLQRFVARFVRQVG